MKVAIGIISLTLMLALAAVAIGSDLRGGITNDVVLSASASTEMMVAFLFLIGGAFAFNIIGVSTIVFYLAAIADLKSVVQFTSGINSISLLLAIGLAIMSHFTFRYERKVMHTSSSHAA